MRRTRDLQDSIPKTKYPPKDTMHNKFYNERPPMRNFTSPINKYYSYKEQDELRSNNIYFSFQEHWVPGHKCAKGKFHSIKFFLKGDAQ